MKLATPSSELSSRLLPRTFSLGPLLAVMLGLLTLVIYWPVTSNDFVNYDDDVYVQLNHQVQKGLTVENVRWAFTHTVSSNWHPLTMLSHMLDCQLYGLNPWGHHLTSLLLHAVNTVLLFLLLHRLTKAVWRSAWVAAIFALHPLHVQSVAWVAERKDVLSAFFGFLALLFYAEYARSKPALHPETGPGRPGPGFLASREYWLACLCFALGLMSKPMLVTWPFVLLLLDFWPLNRFQAGRIRFLVWEKIPFLCLTVAGCAATYLVQSLEGAIQPLDNLGLVLRLENAAISYCRYGLKLLFPTNLAVYYPYPHHWPLIWVLLSILALAGVTTLCWFKRASQPCLLVGWLWFVGTLVPVIGLIQVGSQSIADRYTYLPSVGILLFFGWAITDLTRLGRHQRTALALAGSLTILFCAGLTRQQIACWKNSETLFRHAIAVTQDNDIAHNSLGAALYQQGRTNESIAEYREALRISPNYSLAHMNLGDLLLTQGQTNQALVELQQAVGFQPAYSDARYKLGCLLLKLNQTDEGITQLEAAVHFRAYDPESIKQLAGLLLKIGQTNAALDQFQAAVKTIPADPDLRFQFGNLLIHSAQADDAILQFQEAVRLKPDFFEAHNNLASLLSKKGRMDEAIGELQQSLRLKPDDADAHYNLGALYLKQGRADEAAVEFQTAIRLRPDFAPAHYYLGTILFRKGQTEAAISRFQEAIRLQPDYAFAHNKLGIALGTMGHLTGAITEFQEAVRLKPDYAEANTNLAIALKMQGGAGH